MTVLHAIFWGFSWFVLAYMIFVNATYLSYTVLAFISVQRFLNTRSRERLEQLFRSRLVPPVSVILAAFNEGPTIVDAVHAMMRLLYSQYEVVVVTTEAPTTRWTCSSTRSIL